MDIFTLTDDAKRIPVTFDTMIDNSIVLCMDLGTAKYDMFISLEHVPRSRLERFLESLKKAENQTIYFQNDSISAEVLWKSKTDGTAEIITYGSERPSSTRFTLSSAIFSTALEKFLKSD